MSSMTSVSIPATTELRGAANPAAAWQAALIPGSEPDGHPAVSALAKRTYYLTRDGLRPARRQQPLVDSDQYLQPANAYYSDVTAETDLVAHKPFTDVIVLGKARAPRGRTAYHLDCSAQVGPLAKSVRVYGERRAHEGAFGSIRLSDPEPFSEIDLGYSRAFGGVARSRSGTLYSYPPNPIGCGFALRGASELVAALRIPNLEEIGSPVTPETLAPNGFEDWQSAPRPASLGWTRRNFYPRYTYAGVLPEHLAGAAKNREEMSRTFPSLAGAPLPTMDFRFFQGASEGLWGGPLNGDEGVRLTHLDAGCPTIEFDLPGDRPVVAIDIGDGFREVLPVLHTVVIDMDARRVLMTWRGSRVYGGFEDLPMVRFRVESGR